MKIGQTGRFFKPGNRLELGEFVNCRVIEIKDSELLVELENGMAGKIMKKEFAPMYLITSDSKTKE